MADAAFATGKYPAYTINELRTFVACGPEAGCPAASVEAMKAEIDRREAVAAGDVSQMTGAERLRHFRAKAT